ncbi:MAG TPA: hypothetical protein VGK77_01450 [Candidatus Binatia bacterium]|jgi:hypothetical protein
MLATNGLVSRFDENASRDEQTRRLFGEPDVLAVHEYLHVFQYRPALTPERRLLAALLRDAIDCYMRYCFAKSRREKKMYQETEEWFFGSGEGVFSFENVCEILKLAPGYIRRGLLRYKQRPSQNGDSRPKRLPKQSGSIELRLAS